MPKKIKELATEATENQLAVQVRQVGEFAKDLVRRPWSVLQSRAGRREDVRGSRR